MARFSLRQRSPLTVLLLLVMFIACSSCATWIGHRHPKSTLTTSLAKSTKGHGKHAKSKPKPSPSVKPNPSTTSPSPQAPMGETIFNVVDYGAKGDGVTDDTRAFQAAWSAACQEQGAPSSTVAVPANSEFLVGPVSFSGPCQSGIVFQMDGIIVAPTNAEAWDSGLLQWLEFRVLKGVTIQGQGTIEGKGSAWWGSQAQPNSNPLGTQLSGKLPHIRPTAVRFYGSSGVTITDITIQNGPQCHLKFDSCQGVEVAGVTISSPGDSPNTDGIHLQNSVSVSIRNVTLGCGDDCVSIQTGCSDIAIRNVNCGPGHGISIGGLGKANTQASVANVTIQNAKFVATQTGVRIKTWQGGSGYVKGVKFSGIKVSQVKTPIVIDQFYCDHARCKNQTSAVAVSDVTYDDVQGTYTVQPVHLACSDSEPCRSLHLSNVQLELAAQRGSTDAFCWQAFGDLQAPTQPPINCLLTEN